MHLQALKNLLGFPNEVNDGHARLCDEAAESRCDLSGPAVAKPGETQNAFEYGEDRVTLCLMERSNTRAK